MYHGATESGTGEYGGFDRDFRAGAWAGSKGTPEEKEAKLPEQEEAKGDADSEVPEQGAGSQEAPATEQDGEAENQSGSENTKAEEESPVTGKRGRKSKEK